MTKLLKHSCKDKFQDETYGVGNRIMNHATAKGNRKNRYRCTVCGETRES